MLPIARTTFRLGIVADRAIVKRKELLEADYEALEAGAQWLRRVGIHMYHSADATGTP
jgi:hypothetical protein